MKYRVLVADDEKLIAKNIAKSIEQINPCFEIAAICTDGKEALEYIAENPVHVVFTDIRMPEMDGLELAKHLFLLSGQKLSFETDQQGGVAQMSIGDRDTSAYRARRSGNCGNAGKIHGRTGLSRQGICAEKLSAYD